MFTYSKYHWKIWLANLFIGVLMMFIVKEDWKAFVPLIFSVPFYLYFIIFSVINYVRIRSYVKNKHPIFFKKHFYWNQLRADNYDLRSLKDDT